MAPKLGLQSARAIESYSRPEPAFQARAIAAEIGWIEMSLSGAAAGAIRAVEGLLRAGHAERSTAIYNQLKVFGAFEGGLLATWETPDELICLSMSPMA
jgi:hypothetical protein